jgi:hypothetical protein
LLIYDVLPRAGVIGAGTGNIICCASAPPEGGSCAAEAHIACIIAHPFNAFNRYFVAGIRHNEKPPEPLALKGAGLRPVL